MRHRGCAAHVPPRPLHPGRPGRGEGRPAGLGVPPRPGRGRDGGPDRGRGPRARWSRPWRCSTRSWSSTTTPLTPPRRWRPAPGRGSWPPATSPPSSATSRARARPCGRPSWSAGRPHRLVRRRRAGVRPGLRHRPARAAAHRARPRLRQGLLRAPETGGQPGGGRVTELLARPALALLHPALAGMVQPLSGEYAARRSLVEAAGFVEGYGVDIGLLLDAEAAVGVRRPGPGRPRGAAAPQPEPGRAVRPGDRGPAHDPRPGRCRRPPGIGACSTGRRRARPGSGRANAPPRGPSPGTGAAPPDRRSGAGHHNGRHEHARTSSPSTAAPRSSPAAPAGSAG